MAAPTSADLAGDPPQPWEVGVDVELEKRLTAWFGAQLPDAAEVRVEGLDRVEFGHSAEMLTLTLISTTGAKEQAQDVVVKLRPPSPGLLEPYDMEKQFRVLRALESTDVRAPRAL